MGGLVTDGADIYGTTAHGSVSPGGDVLRVHADGTFEKLATAGTWDDAPIVFGVDEGAVYFRTFGHAAGTVPEGPAYLQRVAKSGGPVVTLATQRYRGIVGAVLDCSGLMWWGDPTGTGSLHRIPKDGGDLETIVPYAVGSFAIDRHDLLWEERKADVWTLHGSKRR